MYAKQYKTVSKYLIYIHIFVSHFSLLHVFILYLYELPEERKTSVVVPIFERKGNMIYCGTYRGVKLLKQEQEKAVSYMCLVDLEKAFDGVLRFVLFASFRLSGASRAANGPWAMFLVGPLVPTFCSL